MNKEQLEKMFDEYFSNPENFNSVDGTIREDILRNFILKSIIPEILKSVIFQKDNINQVKDPWEALWARGFNDGVDTTKNKILKRVKKLYGINL